MFAYKLKEIIALLLVSLLIINCSEKITECERNKVIVGQYYEGLNMGNTGIAQLILDDNFAKYVNEIKLEKFGPSVYLEEIEQNNKNNIDYIYKIEDIIAECNKVVVCWQWKSTNLQLGNPIEISTKGVSIFEFKENKIYNLYQSFDMHNYYEQMGYTYTAPSKPSQNY